LLCKGQLLDLVEVLVVQTYLITKFLRDMPGLWLAEIAKYPLYGDSLGKFTLFNGLLSIPQGLRILILAS